MENLFPSSSWNVTSHVDNPKLRMQSRPPPPRSKPVHSRRTGMAAEDLGSSFSKTTKQTKAKPPLKEKKRLAMTSDSESADELDILPPSSRASSRAGSVVVEDELDRKNTPDALKFLKLNKAKTPQGDDVQAVDVSSSLPPVLKEHENAEASHSRKLVTLSKPPQTTTRRKRSLVDTTHHRPPSRRRQCTVQTQDDTSPKSVRPKPRSLRSTASTVRLTPKALPVVSPPRSPARRMTISGTPSRSFSNLSPLEILENDGLGRPSPAAKPKAQAFPSLSPRAPSKFLSLDLLGSPDNMPVKEREAIRSVSEKIVLNKPLLPVSKVESAETRIRRRPSYSNGSRRTVLSSGDDKGPQEANINMYKPQSFPMDAQEVDGIGLSDKSPQKGIAVRPFPMNIQLLHNVGSPPPPRDKTPRKEDGLTAQPFPLSTQVFNSIGSSSLIVRSTDLKRSSSETYDEPISKKLKRNDPEDEDVEKEVDPKTLCPYCDTLLPSEPTSQLKRLLNTAARNSRPEPRPGNRLGRTAPFTVYIAVCQRHRFESQMLPEAERKGWPKAIDWSALGKRVRKMKGALRALIEDNGGVDSDPLNSKDIRPRARCVFWKEALEDVRVKGTRAVAGVRGQFSSFEKMQPGYYGEMGSVIIHQMLYDLFPLASIDPEMVSPLTASEFLQRILVPEIGARLIMQDMDLDESQMRDAVRILRESANYGVCMFPVDEGEEDEGVLVNAELGAADVIVMKRAMKRRQQLDVDERAEDDDQEEMMEKTKKVDKQEPIKMRERKKKEKELDTRVESSVQASKTRPKPRPIGKSISTTSVSDVEVALSAGDTDTENVLESSQDSPKLRDFTTRSYNLTHLTNDDHIEGAARNSRGSREKSSRGGKMDVEKTPISRTKPRRLPSRSTSTFRQMDPDETPRKAVVPVRSTVDINLCSSSESSADNGWDTGRMKHDQNKKKRRGKSKTLSMDINQDDMRFKVSPSSSSWTRSRERKPPGSDNNTPKTRSKTKALENENENDGYRDISRSRRARERNQRSTETSRQRKESHAWLLSDNTHSSMESLES